MFQKAGPSFSFSDFVFRKGMFKSRTPGGRTTARAGHGIRFGIPAVLAVMVLLGAFPGIALADLHGGLVAHWCFDDCTANDCWDGFDGINYGAACVPGVVDSAFEFMDTDIVRFIPSSWDDSVTTAFTVAAWVYWYGPSSYPHDCIIFDGRDDSWDQAGLAFYILNPAGRVMLHCNQPDSQIQSVQSVPTGTWTHVAVVFDDTADVLSVFLDGQEDNSLATGAKYHNSTHSAALGNNHWAPGDGQWAPFNGVIDEVRIYDRALSDSEIQELAGAGRQVCGYLGDSSWRPDRDTYVFEGSEGEEVTVTLFRHEKTSGDTDGRAILVVTNWLVGNPLELVYEHDRSDLPNEITLTLPCDSTYLIMVKELPDWLPGEPFTGNYCVRMESSGNAAATLGECFHNSAE